MRTSPYKDIELQHQFDPLRTSDLRTEFFSPSLPVSIHNTLRVLMPNTSVFRGYIVGLIINVRDFGTDCNQWVN
jgi:hypothetical protein